MLHEHDCRGDYCEPCQRQNAASPIAPSYPSLSSWRGRRSVEQHSPDMHRLGDVLDRLLAKVFEVERQLVPDIFVDGAGDADTAWVGETLQPRRDVNAVAVKLLAIDDHIAEIDADAKLHSPRGRDTGVFRLEPGLNIDRALDRVYHTGEFGQNAIAGGADKSPVMLFDQPVDDFA